MLHFGIGMEMGANAATRKATPASVAGSKSVGRTTFNTKNQEENLEKAIYGDNLY